MAYSARGESCVDVVRGCWVGQKGKDFGLKADGRAIAILSLLLLARGRLEGSTELICQQKIIDSNWGGVLTRSESSGRRQLEA